jgi:citrate lyase beta subunit
MTMAYFRRSLLFMPADSMRKIEKAAQLETDCVVMDLEDAVAPGSKALARLTAVEALRALDFGRREKLIRLNPIQSEYFLDDVNATIAAKPDGYVIPKVQTPSDLHQAQQLIAHLAHEQGLAEGAMRLLVIIETAQGVMNLREIAREGAQSGAPLAALIFGADDYAADVGAQRTREGVEVLFARSAVVAAAAANRLQAIDIVFFDLEDLPGLEAECRFGRQLGYTGKMVIHPRQLEIVNRVFAPSAEEIAHAQRIVQAAREHAARGVGAFALDGRMVDGPIVKQAETVLAQARAAGSLRT